MKMFKNIKGYTLIEIIIIFAVAAVILTPLTLMMTSSLRNVNVVQRNIDADQSTQQTFIIFNEAIRANGLTNTELIGNYHFNGEALRIDTRVFVLKDNNYVMQTYDVGSEDISSEVIINAFVRQIDYNLTSNILDVSIHIDKNQDGTTDDVYPYKFSQRE